MFNAKRGHSKRGADSAPRQIIRKGMVLFLAISVVAVAALPALVLGNSPSGGGIENTTSSGVSAGAGPENIPEQGRGEEKAEDGANAAGPKGSAEDEVSANPAQTSEEGKGADTAGTEDPAEEKAAAGPTQTSESGKGADAAGDPPAQKTPEQNPDGESTAPAEAPAAKSSTKKKSGAISTQDVGGGIQSVSADVTPREFQTYDDLSNGTEPPELTVTLNVAVNEGYTNGGVIKLSLDYTPNGTAHPDFTQPKTGNDLEPFFTLQTPAEHNAVKKFDTGTEPGVLVITLKSHDEYTGDISGMHAIPLKLTFNANYKQKVPEDTTLWNVKPVAYMDGAKVAEAATVAVKGKASHPLTYDFTKSMPQDEYYRNGTIASVARIYNYNYYETEFDTSNKNQNIAYLDLPAGSTLLAGDGTMFDPKAYFNQGKIANVNGSGYDRYWRNLATNAQNADAYKSKGSSLDWTMWHTGGNAANTYTRLNVLFVPPAGMKAGTDFDFRIGTKYRRINGAVVNSYKSVPYTKQAPLPVDFALNKSHITRYDYWLICGTENKSVSSLQGWIGSTNYTDYTTSKNIGAGDITDVRYELSQGEGSPSSAKVDFTSVKLHAVRDVTDPKNMAKWSHYKVGIHIKGAEKAIWRPCRPTRSDGKETFTIDLPSLGPNQYITSIVVKPTGINGNIEGVLPKGNGIALSYGIKAWEGKKWPDGTEVSSYSEIPMNWKVSYNGAPAPFEGDTLLARYSSLPSASASLVSSNATGKEPGDVVRYEIQGVNNGNYAAAEWANPRVVIRLPKSLDLVSGTGTSLTDVVSGKKYAVTVSLEGSDTNYNYYAFQAASGYSAPLGGAGAAFKIPIQIKVTNAASPGTYNFDRVLVSSGSPASFGIAGKSVNNLPEGESKSLYGFASGNYYLSPETSTPLGVTSRVNIGAGTEIMTSETDGKYIKPDIVPAGDGSSVYMRLTIKNKSNDPVTDIKLYDLLPKSGDSRGSTGTIDFKGVAEGASGATVKYANDTASKPDYANLDLQSSSTTFHTGKGWSTAASAASSAEALYVDFGSATTIAPGESKSVVLEFYIPKGAQQTAYNQFLYSAKQSGSILNMQSGVIAFSTEKIAIKYEANKPVGAGSANPAGIPAKQTAFFGLPPETPATRLVVSSATPTLVNYTFKGWNTEADGRGASYAQNAVHTFPKAGELILHAQWEGDKATVTFNTHGGTPTPANKAVTYGSAYGELPKVTRPGYSFGGWYLTETGGAPLEAATLVSTAGDHTLHAQWARNSFTVTFDGNGGGAPSPEAKAVTYGAFYGPLATVSRPGYTFTDWYTTSGATGGVKVTSGAIVATADNHVLYARWTENSTYTVEYDTAGGSPSTITPKTGVKWTDKGLLPADEPTRTGYAFAGWQVTAGGPDTGDKGNVAPGDTYGSLAKNDATRSITLTARWKAKGYKLSFDRNAADAGTPSKADMSVTYGAPYGELATVARTGYAFAGWYTTSAATGGAEVKPGTTVATAGDHTLYARWSNKPVRVNYYQNYTDSDATLLTSVTAVFDGMLPGYAAPPRAGYDFDGWTTARGAHGQPYKPGETVVRTEGPLDLYAHWSAKAGTAYTVRHYLVSDGGAASLKLEETKRGTTDTTVNVDVLGLVKTYAGYRHDAAHPESVLSGVVKGDGSLVLKLYYALKSYSVRYDLNGGSGDIRERTATWFDTGLLPAKGPVKEGYAFAGWQVTAGGPDAGDKGNVAPGDTYGSLAKNDATMSITLTAQWTANTYTVTFSKGNTGEDEVTLPNPVTFAAVYGRSYGAAVDAVATRTGYFFTGWWTQSPGGAEVKPGTTVATAGDHTLYARWSNKPVRVNYYQNYTDSDATLLTSVTAVFDGMLPGYAAPPRAGYDFDGWTTVRGAHGQPYKPGETVVRTEGPLDLYAHWSAKTGTAYTVRHYLVSDGGAASLKLEETKRGTTDTKAVAIAKAFTGYTYAPGYAKGDGKEVAGGNISGDGGLVLSLYYLINKNGIEYRVTGNMPAGAPAAPATEGGVPYGAARKVAAGRTLAGYGFSGWTTSDVQVGADGGFRMPDGGVTFTGYWTPRTDTPYRVEHYLLAADGSAVLESSSESRGITDMTVNVDALGLAGTYAGYRHDPAHAQSILSGVVKGDGSLVIKLHYALKNYLVTYDTNGGLGRIKVRMATWFDKGLLPAKNPKRSGYKLTGWKCGSRTVTKATVFSALAKNDGVAGVTLTAQWKKTADNDGDGKKKNKKNKDGGGGNSGNNGNGNGGAGDAMGGEGNDAGAADGGVNIADGAPGGAENETTVIANDDNAPTVNIGGEDVPLIGKEDVSFLGLLNIVCLIIMLAVMVRSLTRYASARRRGEKLRATYSRDDGWGVRVRSRWLTPEVILAAIGAVLFFFTDDLSGKMSLTDAYTPMQAAFMTGVIVLHRLASRDMEQALAKESSV